MHGKLLVVRLDFHLGRAQPPKLGVAQGSPAPHLIFLVLGILSLAS